MIFLRLCSQSKKANTMIDPLFRRWRVRPFALNEAGGVSAVLERAVREGHSLALADLRGVDALECSLPAADLRGASLDGAEFCLADFRAADFRGATLVRSRLVGSDLRRANFRRANLREADLRRTDLRGAKFSDADMRGVRLTGAKLDGALIDWRWGAFPVELLRRDPGCRGAAFPVVVELAFERDERPFAWLRELLRKTEIIDWAVAVLGRAILPSDNAPEVLKRLVADVDVDASRFSPRS